MRPITDSGRFQPITGQLWDNAPAQVNQETVIRVTGLIRLGASLLNILIVIRYLLTLLQASSAHPFARLIYDITEPFVSVFQGLTRSPLFSDLALELNTLIAIIAYSLLAWIAVRLVRILFASPK
jgi:uncharacterized protein YggT (Ycf19 family)